MLLRIFAVALALFLATFAQAETKRVYAPNDGFLNLRTGPGGQYGIIMEMDHGTLVDTLEVVGKWARVQHESGAQGWAFRKYLHRVDAGPVRLYVADPKDGWLNLRSGPGTGFAVVGRMDNGTWVDVYEKSGNWVRVHHQYGAEGWAFLPYMTR